MAVLDKSKDSYLLSNAKEIEKNVQAV